MCLRRTILKPTHPPARIPLLWIQPPGRHHSSHTTNWEHYAHVCCICYVDEYCHSDNMIRKCSMIRWAEFSFGVCSAFWYLGQCDVWLILSDHSVHALIHHHADYVLRIISIWLFRFSEYCMFHIVPLGRVAHLISFQSWGLMSCTYEIMLLGEFMYYCL